MTIDDVSKQVQDALREAQATPGHVGPGAKPKATGGVEFEHLLEKLQRLRVTGEKEPRGPGGPEGGAPDESKDCGEAKARDPVAQLSDAVKRADEAHETAMDIKRRLEEAFRRATNGD